MELYHSSPLKKYLVFKVHDPSFLFIYFFFEVGEEQKETKRLPFLLLFSKTHLNGAGVLPILVTSME
jgi:hypothetical protein